MTRIKQILLAVVIGAAMAVWAPQAFAQSAPTPTTAAGGSANVWYGAIPPDGATAPVIVFIHGLRGTASDWWVGNNMYDLAYAAGYRTAFISTSPDNSRNDVGISANSLVLVSALPEVAVHFGVSQFYIVAHSKGGIDAQSAMMNPAVTPLVKAYFSISTPHGGTQLADWAFAGGASTAGALGLLTPGVNALRTVNMNTFRAAADPFFAAAGIPHYTTTGNISTPNPLTTITGPLLSTIVPGEPNDGLVPVSRTKLPSSYSQDLGEMLGNHFYTNQGNLAFGRIDAQIRYLENLPNFRRLVTDGFGDRQNSFAWSMKWFKNKLYVGTGRAFICVTAATSDRTAGTHIYPPAVPDLECTPDPKDLPLAAEIWQWTPETNTWARVFVSEQDIPIEWDASNVPTKFTARDVGFRGMASFVEPDGTEALYVSGVSASSLFDSIAPYNDPTIGFPPPRILRSVDGVNWAPLPQDPGTFLGDIGKLRAGAIRVRGFRSLASYHGKLYITASDFRGLGVVLASADPAAGNNAWQQVSPSADTMPAWTLHVFNDYLYVTTGDRNSPVGYGVYKTDASLPYTWLPVVTGGAYQTGNLKSPDALSIQEFNGALFVGTDRPTELIRIQPDDSWDLIIGAARTTPTGDKQPLSGLGTGAGNIFNGHFWTMASHDGSLYLGTWDWSIGFRGTPKLDPLFKHEFGFDLLRSRDGVHWAPIARNGMGNMFAYGIRTAESTPIGLFIGTANPYHGLEVWRHSETLDLDAPINPLVPPPPAPVTTQINNPLKITAVDASAKVASLIDALIRAMETRTDAAQIEQLLTAAARAVALNSPDKVLLLSALQRVIASLGELGMSFTLAELNTIVGAVERAVLTMVHLPTVPSDLLPTGPIASTTTINSVLQQGTTLLQQSQALTTAP